MDLRSAGGTRYYLLDARGHTRLLLDSQGNITDRYTCDAWGNPIEQVGSTFNPFRWNAAYGYEWTPAIGLYHVGAREYDPRTGRWLQKDPIGTAAGDPNLYRYCANNPINHVDPDGLQIADELSSVTCKRGQYELARMALEEAIQNAAENGGQILLRRTSVWSGSTKWVKHHVFPRALRETFKAIRIDVDKYTLRVPEWYNKWVHSCGPRGGWWNEQWRKFFAPYLDAEGKLVRRPPDKEVLDYLENLLRQTGLGDVKMWEFVPY